MIKYESSIDHPESAPGQEPGHIVSHREAQLGGHVVAKKLPDNGKNHGFSSILIISHNQTCSLGEPSSVGE